MSKENEMVRSKLEKNREKHGLRCACEDYGRDASNCPVHAPQQQEVKINPAAADMRNFSTGATRNVDTSKPDYEAFLSPLVMEAYGKFMHFNRELDNGKLRSGDNWQQGIPYESYMKSGWRHFLDWWKYHRGWSNLMETTITFALLSVIFNASGYLHEILKKGDGTFERDLKVETERREARRAKVRKEIG